MSVSKSSLVLKTNIGMNITPVFYDRGYPNQISIGTFNDIVYNIKVACTTKRST